MKDNKKVLILSIVAIAILIIAAIGATYAYFSIQVSNKTDIGVDTSVTSETKVIYNASEALNLVNAEPGDKIENIFNINLTASNKTEDTVIYNIEWVIEKNNFEYEPEHLSDAQLTYSIYYSDDNTAWNPLYEDVDCTTSKGTLTLANNQILTASADTTNTIYWKVVLEYISHNYNQASNMSKNLTGHLEITGLE